MNKLKSTALLLLSLYAFSCTSNAPSTVALEEVDKTLGLDLLNASIQTYRYFSNKKVVPPKGWSWDGTTWNGLDFFAGTTKEEFFGLVFQQESTGDLLFAFRGTSAIEEWWDDAHASPVSFTPYNGEELRDDLEVEEGFSTIYLSMRENLFEIIDQRNPLRVYITGHSLGSALSELFVFDLNLTLPELEVISYNYACPRLGNEVFSEFYSSLPAQESNPTIRFVNSYDIVPKVPLKWEGYVHLPKRLVIGFKGSWEFIPNYGLRHSADNYYRVLEIRLDETRPCELYADNQQKLVIKD